ncbi:hypothetical protein [Noviherbaspirillum galbum]|uniref:Uncharacterized protein n=1 Tax=Noviherbaspirillum galbum TaxID=2709383 RepID=A0A6B3SXZ9_9BURK|nr:hypothetical protein [Noviherbaspirillum galbum]NEX62709.1 hypothetical protein [Noviherbaspirillum galbum]
MLALAEFDDACDPDLPGALLLPSAIAAAAATVLLGDATTAPATADCASTTVPALSAVWTADCAATVLSAVALVVVSTALPEPPPQAASRTAAQAEAKVASEWR